MAKAFHLELPASVDVVLFWESNLGNSGFSLMAQIADEHVSHQRLMYSERIDVDRDIKLLQEAIATLEEVKREFFPPTEKQSDALKRIAEEE